MEIGVQQGLNYLLFKSDQLLLGAVGASMLLASTESTRQFLFLSRFPEIVSSVAVALGAIILPRLVVESPGSLREMIGRWRVPPRLVAPGLVVFAVGYAAFVLFWRGPALEMAMLPAFAIAALLVIPANTMTYSMLRAGRARALLRNLGLAMCLGGVLLGVASAAHSLVVLAWAVPVQLASFVGLCAKLSWLEPRPLHS